MTIQFGGWEWWQYQNRKIRIDEIDLGITQVFKDKELIEFTIDEEVNKLVEETPINEANITINNMNGMFDLLNPQGIVPYLSENTKIIPYIGVLTESLGIEYVKMGEFYFESYTNNKDKTTTLIGKNLMKQLETRDAISGLAPTTYFIDLNDAQSPNTTYDILTTCGYNVNLDLETKYAYYTWLLNDFNFLNFVRDVTMHNFAVFYVDRNEVLNIKNPVQSNVDTISKNELLEDITFKNIDKINKIKLVWEGWDKTYETSEPVHQTDTYLDETITLKKTSEVFIFKKPVRSMLKNNQNITFTYEGATSINVLVDSSFIVAIEVNGTIGSEVHLVATQTYYDFKTEYNIAQKSMTKNSNVRDKDVMIEITSQLNSFDGNFASATGQLDYAPSYEMEFDYNGDPSLEAGDYISVETPYGYKNLFIQKNHFRYDGGLEGHIEGVE